MNRIKMKILLQEHFDKSFVFATCPPFTSSVTSHAILFFCSASHAIQSSVTLILSLSKTFPLLYLSYFSDDEVI